MKHNYEDIRSRIAEEPVWFDEYAVPRYCEFAPDKAADIYAREVVFFEIRCQGCGHRFLVADSWSLWDAATGGAEAPLSQRVEGLAYGDPPNIGCCAAGPTMTSESVRVWQFWKHERSGWVRDESLEVFLDDEVRP